ncbi:MAG: hypothetical protein Ct9H300mP1_01440 [Planctomycetaceae bacterium]|nr:MAG: hypothetical protein Ct9H300mP1_01440 [Planctomycetaceae bacterium]
MTDTIEYVVTPAVIVVGIGGYLDAVVFTDPSQAPEWLPLAWWTLAYTIFVVINVLGVELTLRFGLIVTGLAAAVLVVFYAATLATGSFDTELLYNIPADEGRPLEAFRTAGSASFRPSRSPSGFTWQSSNCHWQQRNPMTSFATCHGPCCWASSRC